MRRGAHEHALPSAHPAPPSTHSEHRLLRSERAHSGDHCRCTLQVVLIGLGLQGVPTHPIHLRGPRITLHRGSACGYAQGRAPVLRLWGAWMGMRCA